MNTCLFAFYTSPSAAEIGYRWVWADPEIPAELLAHLYSSLTKPLTVSGNSSTMNGGLISLGDFWCAAFRWVDAGRDAVGRAGKLGLVAAFLPRNQLAGLDLLALLNGDAFARPTEEHPPSTSAPIPRFPTPPLSMKPIPWMKRELPGLHSYPELLATAAALTIGAFLLELQRDSRGEFCRLTTHESSQPPIQHTRQTPQPPAVETSTQKPASPMLRARRSTTPVPRRAIAIAALSAAVVMATYLYAKSSATAANSEIASLQLKITSTDGFDLPIRAATSSSEGVIAKLGSVFQRGSRQENAESKIPVRLGQPKSDTRFATVSHNSEEYTVSITVTVEVIPVAAKPRMEELQAEPGNAGGEPKTGGNRATQGR